MSKKQSKPAPAAVSSNARSDAAAGGEIALDLDVDCRGCGAADRTPYDPIRGEEIDGQVITWKRTMCTACGQHRVNRFGRPLSSRAAKPTRQG